MVWFGDFVCGFTVPFVAVWILVLALCCARICFVGGLFVFGAGYCL